MISLYSRHISFPQLRQEPAGVNSSFPCDHPVRCFRSRPKDISSVVFKFVPYEISCLQNALNCRCAFAVRDGSSVGDTDISISSLQLELRRAVDDEDYEKAASLRDEIERRRFDVRLAVEEANETFYSAFSSGSLIDMSRIWGNGDHVQCIHPAAGCISGHEDVLQSWKLILSTGRMAITLEDVRIYATDTYGYVTCIEVIEASETQGRIAATNIFEKQKGKWRIIHHHGSPLPSL